MPRRTAASPHTLRIAAKKLTLNGYLLPRHFAATLRALTYRRGLRRVTPVALDTMLRRRRRGKIAA